jgi:hypothetical protein
VKETSAEFPLLPKVLDPLRGKPGQIRYLVGRKSTLDHAPSDFHLLVFATCFTAYFTSFLRYALSVPLQLCAEHRLYLFHGLYRFDGCRIAAAAGLEVVFEPPTDPL